MDIIHGKYRLQYPDRTKWTCGKTAGYGISNRFPAAKTPQSQLYAN